MSEYNINQTGNNLTAIVDSFKTTLIGSGLSNEVETQIKTLLDGIVSKLPDEEKKDVVDATTKVVEDVKKEGRLTGTAKMLWGGIRETIKSVPAALAAWDALQSTGIDFPLAKVGERIDCSQLTRPQCLKWRQSILSTPMLSFWQPSVSL